MERNEEKKKQFIRDQRKTKLNRIWSVSHVLYILMPRFPIHGGEINIFINRHIQLE